VCFFAKLLELFKFSFSPPVNNHLTLKALQYRPFHAAKWPLSCANIGHIRRRKRLNENVAPPNYSLSFHFILPCLRLALPLHKVGGGSAMKIKGRFSPFYFALRSLCTIFAPYTYCNKK